MTLQESYTEVDKNVELIRKNNEKFDSIGVEFINLLKYWHGEIKEKPLQIEG